MQTNDRACSKGVFRLNRGGAVAALAGVMLLLRAEPIFAADQGGKHSACSRCGCRRDHCDAGIPDHLKCALGSGLAGLRTQVRLQKLGFAVNVSSTFVERACNETAIQVASLYGYNFPTRPDGRGLGWHMNADQLNGFLGSDKARTDGWVQLSAGEAAQHANVGQLTFGVISSTDLNADHGHIFLVMPGNNLESGLNRMTIFDSALNSSSAGSRTLGKAIKAEDFGKIHYYSLRPD